MTVGLQIRVKAFVRLIANECDACHSPRERCADCPARLAKPLLREIALDEATPVVDYSFVARCGEIRRILTVAGCPLLARDIDLKGSCSPQLKFWTLEQMVRKGTLGRKPAYKFHDRKKQVFYYFLKTTTKETK